MPDPDLEPWGADERTLAEELEARPPVVSPALRRRVRDRIGLAFHRRALRRRSAVLAVSGAALLVLAALLALTVPA